MDYSEKKEAKIVNEIYGVWLKAKPEFMKLFSGMKKPNGERIKRERSYFG